MIEFLRKFENHGIKIARYLDSYHKIYQFTVIDFNFVRVRCDRRQFLFIYREIYYLHHTAQFIQPA